MKFIHLSLLLEGFISKFDNQVFIVFSNSVFSLESINQIKTNTETAYIAYVCGFSQSCALNSSPINKKKIEIMLT